MAIPMSCNLTYAKSSYWFKGELFPLRETIYIAIGWDIHKKCDLGFRQTPKQFIQKKSVCTHPRAGAGARTRVGGLRRYQHPGSHPGKASIHLLADILLEQLLLGLISAQPINKVSWLLHKRQKTSFSIIFCWSKVGCVLWSLPLDSNFWFVCGHTRNTARVGGCG